jgi:hypothetical protein
MSSELWIQIIAAASGLITTLAVKYLEHLLKRGSANRRNGITESGSSSTNHTVTAEE